MTDDLTPGDRERIRDRHVDDQFWAARGGRRRPADLAVDHIDGDPRNNDPDNLVVVDPRDNVKKEEL